jgi:hypothetical protein
LFYEYACSCDLRWRGASARRFAICPQFASMSPRARVGSMALVIW